MTKKELSELLKTSGLPVFYHHSEKPQELPFICYNFIGNEDIMADDKPYVKCRDYNVELCTARKDGTLEQKIEQLFEENEIKYDMDEVYIESEKMYEIIYTIQI